MTTKKKSLFLLVLVLAATAFIFSNSLKGSDASTQDSNFVIRLIEAIFGESDLDLHFLVRKGAHIAEFALLGFLATRLIINLGKIAHHLGYGLFYVLVVAVTDEFIQTFTGRSGMVQDVWIDFFGALLGIGLAMLVRVFNRSKRDVKPKNPLNEQ